MDKSDPMNILQVQTDTQWQLIEKFKEKTTKYTPASGTIAIDNNKSIKHKADTISSATIISNNRPKTNLDLQNQDEPTDEISSITIISNKSPKTNLDLQNQDAPIGLIWDSHDHGCAYDAVFTILSDIWGYNPIMWSHESGLMSSFANKLDLAFQQMSLKQKSFENASSSVQNLLSNKYPVAFSYGTSEVDRTDLFVYMFTGKLVGKLKYNCTESLELQVCSQSHIKGTIQFRNI